MIVSWVHISDIHYRKDSEPLIRLILPSFLEALQERSGTVNDPNLAAENPLLFVTGDMSWSGTRQELNRSYELVIEPVRKVIVASLHRVFLCPGNHEIFRPKSHALKVRTYLLQGKENVSKVFNKADPFYRLLMGAFASYASFHRKLFPSRFLHDPGLFFVENLTEIPFSIISLNSAWAGFGGDDDRGYLLVGIPQVSASLDAVPPSNSIITLSHHPLVSVDTGWFADTSDSHSSLSELRNRSSFVFSGHIHKPETFSMVDSHGGLGVSLAGAFCADEWHPYRPLAFSTGWIDGESNTYRAYVFTYQAANRRWVCTGGTDVQSYRLPSRPTSLRLAERPTEVSEGASGPLRVRARDYELVRKSLSSFGNAIRVLWIMGFPGIGKTTFSFRLSDALFKGRKPIHIQRGDENDLKAIARAIRVHSPHIWFEAWKTHGDIPIDKLTDDDLIEIIGEILRVSDIWFIVEAGDSFNINPACIAL